MKKIEFVTYSTRLREFSVKRNQLTISLKSGYIRISHGATEALKIKEGESILLHQDKQNRNDWYLELVGKDLGMPLRKQGKGYVLQYKNLAVQIADSIGIGSKATITIPMSHQPIDGYGERRIYALLTKGAKTLG